jgi:hypothetical protein
VRQMGRNFDQEGLQIGSRRAVVSVTAEIFKVALGLLSVGRRRFLYSMLA